VSLKFSSIRISIMGCSFEVISFSRRSFLGVLGAVAGICAPLAAVVAKAEPALVIEATSGEVLFQDQSTTPWYPASLTKLMTLYVALSAVRDHKIALDTPIVVSARATSQVPSKMGFAPGTEVTLDNALKMLMVKSANDMAVTVAEGVSGSVEAFAEDMNAAAAALGMRQSHFVNPNGLHDPSHVSSARDLAIVARALYQTFPDYAGVYGIGALQLGDETIPTHNILLGRYSGAEGMKTGFTCAAGFNLIASAYRNGHRYIAVVLGAPSAGQRAVKAAILLDRAFAGIDRPHVFPPERAASGAPDMRETVCRRRAASTARFQTELETLQAPLATMSSSYVADNGLFMEAKNPAQKANLMVHKMMSTVTEFQPVAVYVGAPQGYNGLIAQARPPHSPVGTEPPPETADAYAAKTQGLENSATPLKPDVAALPMKGKPGVDPHGRKVVTHAKADEDEDDQPVKKHGKTPPPKHAGKVTKVAKVTKVRPHPHHANQD
jgi:D-alanyl-D-alanine carboxypeptidase